MSKSYWVYILGNEAGMLYAGVTNNIERGVREHKAKGVSSHTKKYSIDRLLFVEEFSSIDDALNAEKRIKGWLRKKKLDLIRTMNPGFKDLSQDWLVD